MVVEHCVQGTKHPRGGQGAGVGGGAGLDHAVLGDQGESLTFGKF